MSSYPLDFDMTPKGVAQLRADDVACHAALLAALGHTDWQLRRVALRTLTQWQERQALHGAHLTSLCHHLVAGLAATANVGLRNACADALSILGAAALPVLQAALHASDAADQRKFIVEVLRGCPAPQAQVLLVQALKDALDSPAEAQPAANLRAALIEAVGHHGAPEGIAVLQRLVQAPVVDLQERVQALHALAMCAAPLPVAQLTAWVDDPSLARAVVPLLGFCGDAAALPALLQVVQRGTKTTRRQAVLAVAQLRRQLGQPMDAALRAFWAQGPAAVAHVVEGLAPGADSPTVEATVAFLALCPDTTILPQVLQACAERGLVPAALAYVAAHGPNIMHDIVAALPQQAPQVQLVAIDTLEAMGATGAVPSLWALLPHAESRVAGAIVRALGQLADASFVQPLMDLIRDADDATVARQAVWSLGRLGQRHLDAVTAPLRHAIACGDVQAAWLQILGSLSQPADVAAITAAMAHQDAEVRRAAVEAASHYGGAVACASLLRALADHHPEVRLAAARALAHDRSSAAVTALIAAMGDADPWVVAQAARSLGSLQNSRGVDVLQRAAHSPHVPVAVAALESLARLAPRDLSETVTRALRHLDVEVVREALQVAAQLDRDFAQEALTAALSHPAWDVRATAAQLLTQQHWLPAAEPLRRALERESEPLVQARLAQLQGRLEAGS
jgi:HEAT repeat protein